MTDQEQREAARQFILKWRGYEKGETQLFWISLLQDVLGVSNAIDYIQFEKQVSVDGNTKFIDGYIPETRILIEQKSSKFDLDKPEPQSGGDMLTPYEQAFRYNNYLNLDEKARWIVTCNFSEIRVYNMNALNSEPQIIRIDNLQNEFKYLDFLIRKEVKEVTKEQDLSIQAGEIVGEIYKALLKQYNDPDDPDTLKSLNALCVRLVFCMYAEDAGIFGGHDKFYHYMKDVPAEKWHRELRVLFDMLNTPIEDRKGYDPDLEAFPYVNGGLFSNDNSEIPSFTDEIVDLILNKSSLGFNWRDISPTIFGAVFESTLNPETRRKGGMHYTSIENIHKVIDPLFLNELKQELAECKMAPVAGGSRRKRLRAFQDKLASLTFFDPALGSGNFCTESYMSIRRLENQVIRYLRDDMEGQIKLDILTNEDVGVKVSISQFYGIEINDFAVSVAKTALWIAEAQMLTETKNSLDISDEFLPLTTNANIVCDNALRMDWNNVIPARKLNYLMGNPPFSGARLMGDEQKKDVNYIFEGWKNAGNLDYVCCWYKKAADYMTNSNIKAALVSTNSVAQGETVANLWKPLFEDGIHFDFVYRTFRWDSEATDKAHVHCVIIGFSKGIEEDIKTIYTTQYKKIPDPDHPGKEIVIEELTDSSVDHINGYLLNAADVFVSNRNKPLCDVPEIGIGNQPIEGGFYLFEKDEMEDFVRQEPLAREYFRKWYGAREFINRKPRYCLWLGDCSPAELRNLPECMKRVRAVREYRLNSTRKSTVKLADRPTRFLVENMPQGTFIVIPKVSSERRRFVPMGFMTPDNLCSDLVFIIPDASLYHFGVLQSNVHMAWMRSVAGRLKSDYRYSKDIVYNNFPWPSPTEDQKRLIENTAQGILDACDLYPECSYADLYDPDVMPSELYSAINRNNSAVMRAYGFNVSSMSETDCVAELMKMYQKLVETQQ